MLDDDDDDDTHSVRPADMIKQGLFDSRTSPYHDDRMKPTTDACPPT